MKILFTGDIAFNQSGLTAGLNPLAGLLAPASGSDAVIFSFDSAVGAPPPSPWKHTFLTCPPEYLDWFRAFPNPVLNLANNHALDGGVSAFAASRQEMQIRGPRWFGAGMNRVEAEAPWIIEADGVCVALLARVARSSSPIVVATELEPGAALFDEQRVIEQAQELRKTCDFVILCLHAGRELLAVPSPEERAEALRLLDHFDLVVGNHPHVVRGSLQRGGRPCFFSLGNTLFGDLRDAFGNEFYQNAPLNRTGLLLEVTLRKGSPVDVKIHSTEHNGLNCGIDPKRRAEKQWRKNSDPLKLPDKPYKMYYQRAVFNFENWGYRYEFRWKGLGVKKALKYILSRKS